MIKSAFARIGLEEACHLSERPVMLFSGGKDSICMLRLAEKAFRPAGFPFPLLHIDTGHNFAEVIQFRDARAAELQERLIVRTVDDAIKVGIATEPAGPDQSRNWLQIPTSATSRMMWIASASRTSK